MFSIRNPATLVGVPSAYTRSSRSLADVGQRVGRRDGRDEFGPRARGDLRGGHRDARGRKSGQRAVQMDVQGSLRERAGHAHADARRIRCVRQQSRRSVVIGHGRLRDQPARRRHAVAQNGIRAAPNRLSGCVGRAAREVRRVRQSIPEARCSPRRTRRQTSDCPNYSACSVRPTRTGDPRSRCTPAHSPSSTRLNSESAEIPASSAVSEKSTTNEDAGIIGHLHLRRAVQARGVVKIVAARARERQNARHDIRQRDD